MESFFRLWRSLPRFFLAALFSLLVAIALAGPDSVAQLLAMFGELPAKYPQVEGINVLLLFALGLVGVLGVLALEAMIAGAELVLARLDRRRALRIRRPLGFRALLLTPIPELAKAYLKTNLSNILAHNRLKSLSTNELIDKEAEVAVHAKRIEDFIGGAVDAEFMEDVNYQGSVTQEQALLDRCKNEIHEIYYLVYSATNA